VKAPEDVVKVGDEIESRFCAWTRPIRKIGLSRRKLSDEGNRWKLPRLPKHRRRAPRRNWGGTGSASGT